MRMTEQLIESSTEPLAAEAASPVDVLPWIISACSVLGGLVLRCTHLSTASLWFDEGYTAWAVSNPAREIIRIIRVDTAPPLYYLLLRGWVTLFGFSETALRSMSALMASIALLVFVLIARRVLKSPWAIALAISLFSFSFMQIAYAHEARFYAMMTMMGAIDLYLVLLVCQRATVLRLAAVATAWTLSLYTNNMMAFYLAGLGLGWLILPGGKFKHLLIVSMVAGALFLPWVPTMLAQTKRLNGEFWPAVPDFWALAHTLGWLAGIHEQSLFRGDWHWFIEIDLIWLGLTALACVSPSTRRPALALFGFGILPVLFIFFYSKVAQSIFIERAFLASGVAFPLVIAMALDGVRSNVVRVLSGLLGLFLLALSCTSIPYHQQGEHPEEWRQACAFAISSNAHHRLVICCGSDGEPLYRYYACDRDYGPRADVTAVPASFFALDPPRTMQRVKSDADLNALRLTLDQGHFDEVVLISSHSWWGDAQGRTLSLLCDRFSPKDDQQFKQIRVFRFIPR